MGDQQTADREVEQRVVAVALDDSESLPGDRIDILSQLELAKSGTESEKNSALLSDNILSVNQSNAMNPSQSVTPTRLPHQLKTILWHNKRVPIVTQNENGPCPLISIANVMLLRGKIVFPPSIHSISADQLIEHIADSILENIPKDLPEGKLLNYEQNMHDAIAVLPRLMTGLDVNVKFTGVQDFEYTPECIIFDLLNIPLYHGWLVDPQDGEAVAAVGGVGYNQLVDKIITNKSSENVAEVTHALVAEQFLERTASQMTYHGLCEINTTMKDGEIAVLFRNNHFATVLKRGMGVTPKQKSLMTKTSQTQNQLFQLVTDQGFLHESNVVWETIDNIDGAGDFVDSMFMTAPPKSSSSFTPAPAEVSQEQQIDQDFLVALSLQEDQKNQSETDQAWEEFKLSLGNSEETISDAQLARRLQERENEQQTQTPMNVDPPLPEKEAESQPPEPSATQRPATPPERKFFQNCQLQ